MIKTETTIELESPPVCKFTGEPMMLQECNGECDNDPELHFEPQWACFCNGGHYQAIA